MSYLATAGAMRARMLRALIIVAAIVAELLALSFTSFAPAARAASPATDPGPKRAVIVVGPVESTTSSYIKDANDLAAALTADGIDVTKIYAPNATWKVVKDAAMDADFFAYLGHGNGWPSPYAPFQEDSKDGLGLDKSDGSMTVKYYGECFLIGGSPTTTDPATGDPLCTPGKNYGSGIRLAPNAIVLLNHLCYSDGNGEPGMAIPNQNTAFQRVDNMASGWLAAGARVVWALGWQPGKDIATWLGSEHLTMEEMFELRDAANGDPNYLPYHGWVGYKPDIYLDSVRTPGATIHLDPDLAPAHKNGYLRAITGDLGFTTDEWWNGSTDTTDTTPPVISDLALGASGNTEPAGHDSTPVFTPNGDGLSDTLTINHTLSEQAYLAYSITKADDSVVRTFTTWTAQGPGSDSWDGKNNKGHVVPDGTYTITVTPKDAAGNVGDPVSADVKLLTAMRAPAVSPSLFNPSDGDALAQTEQQSLTLDQAATLSWVVEDADGNVVRTVMDSEAHDPGAYNWTWDGKDDSGDYVPFGIYSMVVTARTDAGSYSQQVGARVMPFKLKMPKTVTAGHKVKLTLITAEPQKGWPVVKIRQPGHKAYSVSLIKYSSTKFIRTFTLKTGAAGTLKVIITGTDTGGGVDKQTYLLTIQ
jgi:flagellar hook assembly protein FlgD